MLHPHSTILCSHKNMRMISTHQYDQRKGNKRMLTSGTYFYYEDTNISIYKYILYLSINISISI